MFKLKALACLLLAQTICAQYWDDSYKRLPSCPNNDNPAYPTHLPHPTDCTKFYKCDRGIPVIQDCPAGLHWSVTKNQCEWPNIARCQNQPSSNNDHNNEWESTPTIDWDNGNDYVSTPPIPIYDPVPDYDNSRDMQHDYLCYNKISDFISHPTNCRKFIQCSHGYAYTFNCTARFYWNDQIKRCDYYENVNCRNYDFEYYRSTPGYFGVFKAIQQNDKPIRDYRCPVNEDPANATQFSYPGNCAKFYKCDRGLAYPLKCPAGLHWNSRKNICDWPQLANCRS